MKRTLRSLVAASLVLGSTKDVPSSGVRMPRHKPMRFKRTLLAITFLGSMIRVGLHVKRPSWRQEGLAQRPLEGHEMPINLIVGTPRIIDMRQPTLTDVVGSAMAFAEAMYQQSPAYKKAERNKRKTWHCRKCGAEFHPIRHPELCEECRPK